jgi:uncharacterized protein with PQ loop repeat
MIYNIATLCIAIALFLDTLSYWRQIKKTIRTKKSSQISTTSFLYKIGKAAFALIGLGICTNWVGFTMECFMALVYIVSLYIISRYKPRGWKLFK